MQQSFQQQNPQLIYRSELFSLETTTYFACNLTYTQTNAWLLTQIDGSSAISIDLSSNPTWKTPELVIQGNTLAYGLYEFTYQVVTSISDLTLQTSYTTNVATFIQIIPTGLVVSATKSGVSSILLGAQQSFDLNPSLYSVDLDGLVQPSTLSFKFYCQTVNMNASSSQYSSQYSGQIDLFEYKLNSALQLTSNKTCFASTSMDIDIFYFYLFTKQ